MTGTLNVYLAAPYAARDKMRGHAAELTRIGYKVTCRWIEETHEISKGTVGAANDIGDDDITAHAKADLDDIRVCHVLVAFTADSVVKTGPNWLFDDARHLHTGGRHVETGFALALGRDVIVVGEPENVFHRLPQVTRCPDWHEALIELSARLVTWEREQPQERVS